MRITITDDEGEVYATLRDVNKDGPGQHWVGTDDDGDDTLVTGVLEDATNWERRNR